MQLSMAIHELSFVQIWWMNSAWFTKSTFLASPEGGTAHTKSCTDQNRGTKSRTNPP